MYLKEVNIDKFLAIVPIVVAALGIVGIGMILLRVTNKSNYVINIRAFGVVIDIKHKEDLNDQRQK